MRRIRRPSHGTVAAYLALFVALGGGTTAVALNGQNTVQSDDLGPGAQVKAADLAKLSFTTVKANPLADNPCASGQVGVFCGIGGTVPRHWKNLGKGYVNVAYARDGLGIVHLRGTMAYTTFEAPSTSFILPSGYRPPAKQEFTVAYGQDNTCIGSTCEERLAVVQIGASGAVVPLRETVPSGAVGHEYSQGVSLDEVQFRAK
jgi:hypothetical protein